VKYCLKVFSRSGFVVLCVGLLGCAGVPMTFDVEKVIGKPFTNPPLPEERWVTAIDQGRVVRIVDPASRRQKGNFYRDTYDPENPVYYKKQTEGVNTRYFILWGAAGLCVYSLLVGPDDIILSWRNEGKRAASDCRRG
jgi:hypothetical protein